MPDIPIEKLKKNLTGGAERYFIPSPLPKLSKMKTARH